MTERAIIPTQSALLELKDERAGMREGYRFLDEKRLILASEILAELARYEGERAAFDQGLGLAAKALEAAVMRHGVEELGLYPPDPPVQGRITLHRRSVLGVIVNDLDCALDEPASAPTCFYMSPEAERCREAFRALLPRSGTDRAERLREPAKRRLCAPQ